MYLWHRANHKIPLLWRFHRMHHIDRKMDSTTGLRFHPGEFMFSSSLRLIVIPFLGINAMQLFFYEIILQPIIIFHHSNIALPEKFDRLFRVFIVTPNMHRVHHSQEIFETNSNYASIFSFWDRLFITFKKRKNTLTINYGLKKFKDKNWEKFSKMIILTFR